MQITKIFFPIITTLILVILKFITNLDSGPKDLKNNSDSVKSKLNLG